MKACFSSGNAIRTGREGQGEGVLTAQGELERSRTCPGTEATEGIGDTSDGRMTPSGKGTIDATGVIGATDVV